jgi:hypothetical protein
MRCSVRRTKCAVRRTLTLGERTMSKSGNIALTLAMLFGATLFAMRQYHASGAPLQFDGNLCYTIAPYAMVAILALLSIIRTKSIAFPRSLRITATLMLLATVAGYADFASRSTGGVVFVFLPGLLITGGIISLLICDLAISLSQGNGTGHSRQKSK